MITKVYLTISGLLFGLVSVLHLVRLIFSIPVQISSWQAPMWISWGGFFGAAILCIWAFWLRTKIKK